MIIWQQRMPTILGIVVGMFICALTSSPGGAVDKPGASAATHPSAAVLARTYGPANETCTTAGIALQPGDNWRKRLESASPGDVFLLHAGTYTISDTLVLPPGNAEKPILFKAYNCEAAALVGESTQPGHGVLLRPGAYNTIAGLRIESATHEKLIEIHGQRRQIEFRNNTLSGGRNDAITIRGGTADIVFIGNDINSGPGQPPGVTAGSGGHVLVIGVQETAVPQGVRIARNRIRGAYFGNVTAGDDTIAIAGGDQVVIEENWFTEQYNIEQVIDIKSRLSRVPVRIRGNVFENNFLGTYGGQDKSPPPDASPEITIGDHDTPATVQQHVIEGNRFERGISIGSSARIGSALIRNNIFHAKATNAPHIVFNNVYNTLIVNNTFYRGGFKIGRAGHCIPIDGLVFKNNIFYETYVRDQTDRCPTSPYKLLHNNLYRLPGRFKHGQQPGNITTDPLFVNPTAGDFRLQPSSPAGKAGEGGRSMGTIN
jgi:hypothetical protein